MPPQSTPVSSWFLIESLQESARHDPPLVWNPALHETNTQVALLQVPTPFAGRVVQAERVNGSYDAAILLECDSVQRTRLEGLESHFLINIDHHKSGRNFAHVNWIDPKAVATAEMVYRLARQPSSR